MTNFYCLQVCTGGLKVSFSIIFSVSCLDFLSRIQILLSLVISTVIYLARILKRHIFVYHFVVDCSKKVILFSKPEAPFISGHDLIKLSYRFATLPEPARVIIRRDHRIFKGRVWWALTKKWFFITLPWFRPVFMPVERDYNRVFRVVWVQTSL